MRCIVTRSGSRIERAGHLPTRTGHRGYLHIGSGTIRTGAHISTPKSHRAFSSPIRPQASTIPQE